MIKVSKSYISKNEIDNVSRILKKQFLGMGPEVKKFENELSNIFGRSAICVVNGTAAIQLALQSAGIKRGDEVLVQSLTYVSTIQAISALGIKPVFCDIEKKYISIDLDDVEKKITKKTKAILPVHYAGQAGNLDKIYKFAKKNKIFVIEDAAHAFGSKYKNNLIGKKGDIVCFSFDGIKNITSGEGGVVITSNKNIIKKIKSLRLLGVINDSESRYQNKRKWDFNVKEQGWRYHMSDIMASIGRVQLANRKKIFLKRTKIASQYISNLKNYNKIKLILQDIKGIVPHIFPIIISSLNNRNKIRQKLLEHNIETGIHYKPNHLLSFYKKNNLKLPNTEMVYKNIITLPLHPAITIKQVNFICKTLKKTINTI
jgi:dTDP-4-amino-4,6-dideoxygalactose transaminase